MPADRRLGSLTLPGLGFREEADTLPALFGMDVGDDTTPISCVRVKTAPRSTMLPPPPSPSIVDDVGRVRPVTLLDDVHDAASRDFLEEARRLLASGIFETFDSDD
jgi:hypothetical protein